MQLLIFDLDGVLVDSKDIHFEAFNKALVEHGYLPLTYEVHMQTYNGLPTKTKLLMLGLPESIAATKQKYTTFDSIEKDLELGYLLGRLQKESILCVASNSIRSTIYDILDRLGIRQHFLFIRSNEDVTNPKPDPEIYNSLIEHFPTLYSTIFEDSPIGLQAARASKADYVEKIQNRDHLVKVLYEYINPHGG
jgi:beta-phosphoglucomutase-like phosphatase (HAD superfamily)